MQGEFLRLFIYRSTWRPRRTSLPLECHCNTTNRLLIGLVPFQALDMLPVVEEQSRTRCNQSSGDDDDACYLFLPRLWHSSSPSARSLSRSPSPPPPSFTQSPSLPISLVCDGQTNPQRPRLVVSFRTCPPLSPSAHTNSFGILQQ
jgi:hypothetical protein